MKKEDQFGKRIVCQNIFNERRVGRCVPEKGRKCLTFCSESCKDEYFNKYTQEEQEETIARLTAKLPELYVRAQQMAQERRH